MASSRRASGAEGLGRRASSVASVKEAASANAGSIGASTGGLIDSRAFLKVHRFGAFGGTVGTEHNLFQAHLGAFELFLAMRLKRHAAFIERDGILEIDFA